MKLTVTMRDLISAVSEYAEDENELVATVVHLVQSGRVKLVGGSWSDDFTESPA
ncbi:MAG: hypothetical protein P8R42_26430 [Candidatus Binatia bacterium]|nr:hypothetical protein [Candidatus Binatia bacterium]